MLSIQIICIGSLKEKYWKDACAEYLKRLRVFCKMEIMELSEEKMPDRVNESHIQSVLEAEGKRILDKIPQGSYVLPMCIEGKQMSSEELSAKIDTVAVDGFSNISFIIGGSYGLSQAVKSMGKEKLSMSKMTFPHQFARVMLLEQIYRAFQISSGGKYHK